MEPSANVTSVTANRYRKVNVILIIMCLSFCSKYTLNPEWHFTSENILYSPMFTVPGLILLLILTECKGRRILFISLFLLFILSFYIRFFLAVVQVATIILTPIVLCEYSDPKFRMVYLIANSAVQRIAEYVSIYDYNWELDCFKIGMALVCIFSIMVWPESPYWLASKKRFEESKQEFLSLRRENSQSRIELKALIEETPRRGSLKMVYAPLLIAFPIYFTSTYLSYLERLINKDQNKIMYAVIVNVICALVIALICLKVSRRFYFLFYTAILFIILTVGWILHETLNIFEYNKEVQEAFITAVYIVTVLGPVTVYVPMSIEMIPQKYVSIVIAVISCVYCFINVFADGLYGLFDEFPILCLSVFLSFVSGYFLLPEAKDKTLFEIEHLYLPKIDKSQQRPAEL